MVAQEACVHQFVSILKIAHPGFLPTTDEPYWSKLATTRGCAKLWTWLLQQPQWLQQRREQLTTGSFDEPVLITKTVHKACLRQKNKPLYLGYQGLNQVEKHHVW